MLACAKDKYQADASLRSGFFSTALLLPFTAGRPVRRALDEAGDLDYRFLDGSPLPMRK